MDNEDERDEERPRPKVVDKRISARSAEASEAKQAQPDEPAPSQSEPIPVPPAEEQGSPTTEPETPGAAEPLPADPNLWTPEQEAEARRLAHEVAQTPSIEWVVNVAVTLANVAGTKLDLGAPADAQLAIDALAALVERLGSRLDTAEAPLRQTLAQLQLAYAEHATPPPTTP